MLHVYRIGPELYFRPCVTEIESVVQRWGWWIVKELGKMKSCCLLMIWPQFCSRARWRSSCDSWARALAKLAVTNEFSSFALARRITMRCKYMGEWYSRRGHFVLALDPCLIYEINGGRQRNQPNFVPVNELMSIFEQIWETRKHIHDLKKYPQCRLHEKKSIFEALHDVMAVYDREFGISFSRIRPKLEVLRQ